ncbi:MAG TPA: MmgE/PrpD family protein [candidate division Zixibacteria bacterium]|nr:MmgE/PrpD family protein [candidate division Zixibacteria bacterium]
MTMRPGATRVLARYAVALRYRDIPGEVLARAKDCLLDTLAVALYGSTKPWSRSVVRFVRGLRAAGPATIAGQRGGVPPHLAALANGVMAHAFELDNVRQPGAGVHPGATAFLPALAVAEARRASGKDFLAAFVAGCEVMSRIGVAAGNSLEKRGFHAPGLTGTFGAAVAAAKLLGLGEDRMVHALGIAGSYSGGLLEFSRCREGAMVKRLHLGKAAEGGTTAAFLARGGFAGPETVLEGEFGFCRAFSDAPDPARLTRGLGREFESLNICIKRYACHINAHAPIEALEALRRRNGFRPDEIAAIEIGGIEKLVTHHAIHRPADLMAAQYSIPFCVALSLYRDPKDPESFSEKIVSDPRIAAAMRKVRLRVDREIERKGWDRAARVNLTLKGGRRLSELVVHFRGTPRNPLSRPELEEKVALLTRRLLPEAKLARLIETVDRVERLDDASQLGRLLRAP